jgi:L-phenylalanine/L-methionine N-acetyltransferase
MIRNITESDFDFIYKLYMHPATNPYLLYEVMSEAEFRLIFNELLAQNIIYIFSENNQNIGMFKLVPLTHRSGHINYLGGVALDPDFAGKGYGSKMFTEIIALGREKGLKRIELSTSVFNQKAIKLYEKHGFQYEGILKNYTYLKSEDKYIDEQYMAYLYI